ncbi:MAG: hypothetical protein ABH885_05055, partial [Candidatus Omnitrophota bacterium]
MKKTQRFISITVLLCFLVNTASYGNGLSFDTRINVDKLAAPMFCDDLAGIEHKDMGRIKFALQAQLTTAFNKSGVVTLHEPTRFQPVDMQFFFNEIETIGTSLKIIKCRVRDGQEVRAYYAVFKPNPSGDGYHILEVYTNGEYERFKEIPAFKNGDLPGRKADDAASIDRYIRHEEGIDAWIARRMRESGSNVIIQMNDSRFVNYLTGQTKFGFFNIAFDDHPERLLKRKRIVIIGIDSPEDVPYIYENGRKIPVGGHTSGHSTYVFLNKESFGHFRSAYGDGKRFPASDQDFFTITQNEIAPRLAHEVGVMCGDDWQVTADGRIESGFDTAYRDVLAYADADEDNEDFGSVPSVQALKGQLRDVNLNYLMRAPDGSYTYSRDYAVDGDQMGGSEAIFRTVFDNSLIRVLSEIRVLSDLQENRPGTTKIQRDVAAEILEKMTGLFKQEAAGLTEAATAKTVESLDEAIRGADNVTLRDVNDFIRRLFGTDGPPAWSALSRLMYVVNDKLAGHEAGQIAVNIGVPPEGERVFESIFALRNSDLMADILGMAGTEGDDDFGSTISTDQWAIVNEITQTFVSEANGRSVDREQTIRQFSYLLMEREVLALVIGMGYMITLLGDINSMPCRVTKELMTLLGDEIERRKKARIRESAARHYMSLKQTLIFLAYRSEHPDVVDVPEGNETAAAEAVSCGALLSPGRSETIYSNFDSEERLIEKLEALKARYDEDDYMSSVYAYRALIRFKPNAARMNTVRDMVSRFSETACPDLRARAIALGTAIEYYLRARVYIQLMGESHCIRELVDGIDEDACIGTV